MANSINTLNVRSTDIVRNLIEDALSNLNETERQIMANRVAENGLILENVILMQALTKYNEKTETIGGLRAGLIRAHKINGLKADLSQFMGTSEEFFNALREESVFVYYEGEHRDAVHIGLANKLFRRNGDRAKAFVSRMKDAIAEAVSSTRYMYVLQLFAEAPVEVNEVIHEITEETREGVKKTFIVRSTNGDVKVVLEVNESRGVTIYKANMDDGKGMVCVVSASEQRTMGGLHNLRSNKQVIVAAAMDADSRFTPAIKKMCQ